MLFINDLLELKDRNLYLDINGKRIPMSLQYYVADDIFFFETTKETEKINTLEDLRNVLEEEAKDECWAEDIYVAPMEKIFNCELVFPKNLSEVIDKNIFNDNYTIVKLDTTMEDIIIYLV